METTFGELKDKEVVNVVDGARLGHINDLVLEDKSGKIIGIIVPGSSSIFSIFKKSANSIYIPYTNICKIGEDVILVELFITSTKVRTLKNSNVYDTSLNKNTDNIQN